MCCWLLISFILLGVSANMSAEDKIQKIQHPAASQPRDSKGQFAKKQPPPAQPPLAALRESGAAVHEPMVRLLHWVPSLLSAPPGPAWAALLAEAEREAAPGRPIVQRFTDEWFARRCAALFEELDAPRYSYAGADPPPQLRLWLAAATATTGGEEATPLAGTTTPSPSGSAAPSIVQGHTHTEVVLQAASEVAEVVK